MRRLALLTAASLLAAPANAQLSSLSNPSGATGTAGAANTGTSGHTVPYLDGANTWSGSNTFNGTTNTITTNGRLNVSGGLEDNSTATNIRFANGAGGPLSGSWSGNALEIIGNNGGVASVQAISRPGGSYYEMDFFANPFKINHAGTGVVFSSAATGITVTGAVTATTGITSSGATSGIGYATGAGGAVTQLTSRTTGVTLNKMCGEITLFSTTTTAGQVTTFTVTDSGVAATDVIVVDQKSGTGIYIPTVTAIGSGTFNLSVYTPAAVGSAEAPKLQFCTFKGATS